MAGLMVAVALNSSITLLYPVLVGTAIDNVIVGRNTAVLPGIILLLVGLVLAQALLSFWQNYWSTVVGEKIVIDLRTQLYRHLQQLSLSFFQDNHTGDLLSRLTNDVMLVRDAVTNTLMGFVSSIFTVLIGIIVIVVFCWLVWYSRRHSLASGRIIGAQWLVRKWLSTCALSYIATSNNYRSVSFRTTTPATC